MPILVKGMATNQMKTDIGGTISYNGKWLIPAFQKAMLLTPALHRGYG